MITGTGSQGNMTFNLRGLGSQNTLVLVNGRRLSGAAALDGDGANVAGIPVNAIERIEVVTDGGSAIYGSDAVAGTVNIILRKDFVGSETLVRYENSGSEANSQNISQMVGFGWGSGNLTANLSYQKMNPILARRTGYTTLDLSNLPGGYDGRGTEMTIQTSDTEGALGPDVDPDNFTVDDIDPDAIVQTDQVEKFLSPDTVHMGFWTTLRQQLGSKVMVNLDISYNKTRTGTCRASPRWT